MIAQSAFGLEVGEWAIIIGAIVFTLDVAGLSRSSRTVRRENADMRERSATLEGETKTKDQKILALERERDELKAHNVDALFLVMREHDERMAKVALGMTENLASLQAEMTTHEEQAALRHGRSLALLEQMTEALREVAR